MFNSKFWIEQAKNWPLDQPILIPKVRSAALIVMQFDMINLERTKEIINPWLMVIYKQGSKCREFALNERFSNRKTR